MSAQVAWMQCVCVSVYVGTKGRLSHCACACVCVYWEILLRVCVEESRGGEKVTSWPLWFSAAFCVFLPKTSLPVYLHWPSGKEGFSRLMQPLSVGSPSLTSCFVTVALLCRLGAGEESLSLLYWALTSFYEHQLWLPEALWLWFHSHSHPLGPPLHYRLEGHFSSVDIYINMLNTVGNHQCLLQRSLAGGSWECEWRQELPAPASTKATIRDRSWHRSRALPLMAMSIGVQGPWILWLAMPSNFW